MVLEWDPIQLATAQLRSLSLYRNGSKAGSIPRPAQIQSTKISGLAVDTDYTFHLVLRTSAGTFSSEKLTVRTHKMTDLSGITITPGILPGPLRGSLAAAVERIGAKLVETVRIDTTHFVCTEGRGQPWEKAVEMNIPVVRPEWVEGCEREGRIVGVRGYYLNADPRLRHVGQGVGLQQRQQQLDLRPTSGAGAQHRITPGMQESRQGVPPSGPPAEQKNGAEGDRTGGTDSGPAPPPKDDADTPTSKHAVDQASVHERSTEALSVSSESESQSREYSEEQGRKTMASDGERTPGDGNSFSEVQL